MHLPSGLGIIALFVKHTFDICPELHVKWRKDRTKIMRQISLEELLEAGCHFGHQVNRRNPKADEFIFEERSNVHIINLEKTLEGLLAAGEFLKDTAAQGGSLIIVGSKRQAQTIVKEEIEKAREEGAKNLFFITSRWIGGMLTNSPEVSKNFKKLKDLESFLASGKRESYTKKEMLLMEREKNKLKNLYEGVVDLSGTPTAIFIIDTHLERTAVLESKRVGVTTVGIVDTNADPAEVNYPIPANDDAVSSISLITSYIVDAWKEGSKKAKEAAEKQEKEAQKAAEKEEKKAEKAKKEEAKPKTSAKTEEKKPAKK